jgi:hypothetical protein
VGWGRVVLYSGVDFRIRREGKNKRGESAVKTSSLVLAGTMILAAIATADSWIPPYEKDYWSSNRNFVAHVTPAEGETKARLQMFEVKEEERVLVWECALGNEGAPQRVFITDDGRNVATVNEWSHRVHGGLGDFVLAFYDTDGLIKNYSLEELLHYPDRIGEKEFQALTQRSVSGRQWASNPMFLYKTNDQHLFCVWLCYGERWLAWDVITGSEVEVDENLVDGVDEKAHQWALDEGLHGKQAYLWYPALKVLARLKRPEDRQHIEPFLASESFYTRYRHTGNRFERYYASSGKRDEAERLLADWDGVPAKEKGGPLSNYRYLGIVRGTMSLPKAPQPEDENWLCLYLVPKSEDMERWYAQIPVHRLWVLFSKYHLYNREWPGETIPFTFYGVTPGEYRVKAVWDTSPPHTFQDHYITGPPSEGDYENEQPPLILVEAGEAVKDVTIDCTHEVGPSESRSSPDR